MASTRPGPSKHASTEFFFQWLKYHAKNEWLLTKWSPRWGTFTKKQATISLIIFTNTFTAFRGLSLLLFTSCSTQSPTVEHFNPWKEAFNTIVVLHSNAKWRKSEVHWKFCHNSTTIFSFSMEIINNLTQTQKRTPALARNDFFGSDKQVNFFNHIYTKFFPFWRTHDMSVLSNRLVAYLRSSHFKN